MPQPTVVRMASITSLVEQHSMGRVHEAVGGTRAHGPVQAAALEEYGAARGAHSVRAVKTGMKRCNPSPHLTHAGGLHALACGLESFQLCVVDAAAAAIVDCTA